jgi:hypothetical protein
MKRNITLTIETDVVDKAKKAGVNISSAAEDGIITKINHQDLELEAIYPEELAVNDPEHYWINPSGECHKRGEELFFVAEHGAVIPLSKKEYMKRLNIMARSRYSSKSKKPNPKNLSVIPNLAAMDRNADNRKEFDENHVILETHEQK